MTGRLNKACPTHLGHNRDRSFKLRIHANGAQELLVPSVDRWRILEVADAICRRASARYFYCEWNVAKVNIGGSIEAFEAGRVALEGTKEIQ